MDRLKFLALVPFRYSGHFNLMKRFPLVYCKTGTWEQKMSVHDATDNTWWPVTECTDEGFAVCTRAFGLVRIKFSECIPVEPG